MTFPDSPLPAFMAWTIPALGERYEDWQAGRCAMCGALESLVLDHDHQTGLTRGLLCRPCNMIESSGAHPAWGMWGAGCTPARLLGQESPYRGRGPARRLTDTDQHRAALAIEAISHLAA